MHLLRISSVKHPGTSGSSKAEAATSTTLRARLAAWLRGAWRWLQKQEAEPAPFDAKDAGRIGLLLVAGAFVAYCIIMIGYVLGLQETFNTSAEDLGIMDQVLWNTSHGHFMLQSICNSVTDTNCLAPSFSRFAIHFEPILIPLSLIYLIKPSVKLILVLQVIVVGSGAFPAYLLATRRLRNVIWGILFAVMYLAFPSLQAAVTFAFHPETLAAMVMMWALFCLATRRYTWLIICCVIMLLCKETLSLDVIMIGIFVALLQRRPRVGLSLVAAGIGMLAVALLVMHIASPTGQSPVASRLTGVQTQPLATLASMVTDPRRHAYLLKLFAPTGFLALFSPWMVALALPSILLNMASSYSLMYSGLYQYNTDIVPILVAASIDALVWLAPLVERWTAQLRAALPARVPRLDWGARLVRPQLLLLVLVVVVGLVAHTSIQQAYHVDTTIVRQAFPSVSQHSQLGERIAESVPQDASVSAQSTLVPHLSERHLIYQFPFQDAQADYVFVDVTTGDFYPFANEAQYVHEIQRLLTSCRFEVVTAEDGYLLLHRRADPPAPGQACSATLPPSFYSFAYISPPPGTSPAGVLFANTLDLIGYSISPPSVSLQEGAVTKVTTYWLVLAPITQPLTIVTTFTRPDGTRIVMEDAWTQSWLPASRWQPGQVVAVVSWPHYFTARDKGNLVFGVEVRAGAPAAMPPAQAAVPAMLLIGKATGPDGLPRLTPKGTSALLTIMPVQ